MKEWHFYEKVYRRWVVLFIGPFEDFKEEMRLNKLHDVEELQDAKGMCVELTADNHDGGQNCTVVWLREYDSATLVHEITHLVMMNFDQVLVPISRDNTESFGFYAEYWWTEFTRARRKHPEGTTPTQAKKGV